MMKKLINLALLSLMFISFAPVKGNLDYFSPTYEAIRNENSETLTINNKDELISFINDCSSDGFSKNKKFSLTSDIDLQGETINPIAIFKGELDGLNHRIFNFTLLNKHLGHEIGFIRRLEENGQIKNLNIEYSFTINEDKTILGGLVGVNNGEISNCSYSGRLQGSSYVGGIAGLNDSKGSISSSYNNGEIIGKIFVGGVTGNNKGDINNCKNNGEINNFKFASSDELIVSNIGGVAGFNQNIISNCTNDGSIGIRQVGNFVGGIVGSNIGKVLKCQNLNEIKGSRYIGGIIGYYAEFIAKKEDDTYNSLIDLIEKIIKDLENNNKPDQPSTPIITSSSAEYCINKGDVLGDLYVGGICGYASNDNIKSQIDHVFDVKLCVNKGMIQASKTYAGGICGYHNVGNIMDCLNVGFINSKTANYVGGIVGYSCDSVSYCFTNNDIIADLYVGGIGGSNKNIHDCVAIIGITSHGFQGAISGFIQEVNEKVFDNYYVNEFFYGIDNIDYENKTTRVDKAFLACKDNLSIKLDETHWIANKNEKSFPLLKNLILLDDSDELFKEIYQIMDEASKFGSYVSFFDSDGEIIKKIFVPYGSDLKLSEIPEVPLKDGHFGKWEEFDNKNITNNLYISPIYDEIIRSIASSKGPRPDVIVEGQFYVTSKVEITSDKQYKLPKDSLYTYILTYQVAISDEYNKLDTSKIHVKLLIKDKLEKPSIGKIHGDKIEFIDSYLDGDYICFDLENLEKFSLLDQEFANKNNPNFIMTIVFSVLGGLVVIGGATFIIIYVVKKHKKVKKINK